MLNGKLSISAPFDDDAAADAAAAAPRPARPAATKADAGVPEADAGSPKPARRPGVRLDDRPAMWLGSLGFGLVIPLLGGLYGSLGPGHARWWLAQAVYIALALAIWAGNRWLLFKQRQHYDWFGQPWRKLVLLVAANVLYTAPVTVLGLWLGARLAGQPQPPAALQKVVAVNVVCVLFVTHAYETLFLIRERESDRLQVERLERARAQAELDALKAQIDPHFLFNSLNTLGHLIAQDPARAGECCDTLADIYRYVLAARDRDLVPLAEELAFVQQYQRLLQARFGDAVQLLPAPGLDGPWLLPPLALQTLLENAVKHNRTGRDEPLQLRLQRRGDCIVAHNRRRPRSSALPGGGRGLANLDERCRLLSGRALRLRCTDEAFEVELPLVAAA
jgi:hypothetical protein